MNGVLIFVLSIAVVGALLGVVAAAEKNKRVNLFKTQVGAWFITIIMVVAAIGIGYAKAPANNVAAPRPDYPAPTIPPMAVPTSAPVAPVEGQSYVWDNAHVLSDRTVQELDARNEVLWTWYSASIGVVTCNYGRDDLGEYALQCAEDMGLGGYDFIVVLDISGENYWLIQGDDLRRDFTDNDCSDYAYDCMEREFARGDYDGAVLNLTEALENWYESYYG